MNIIMLKKSTFEILCSKIRSFNFLQELAFENVGSNRETLGMIRDLILWKQNEISYLSFINMGLNMIDIDILF